MIYLLFYFCDEISEYSKKNVCFIMFLDEQTLLKLSIEGNVPDERVCIGLWRIVIVRNLPYKDMRKTGKVPKFLSHRFFRSSRYSIWLDSKMRLQTDPMLIIEFFFVANWIKVCYFKSLDSPLCLGGDVPEGSFIVRAHIPMSSLFSCLWFNEVNRFTSCDPLSFAYTFLRLKRLNLDRPFFLNMFKPSSCGMASFKSS